MYIDVEDICYFFKTMEMAEQHQWQFMVTEWEKEKVKILNHLIGSGEDIAVTDDTEVSI